MSKVLLEILEGIPRSYDVARIFYNGGTPPIFEVILPMTTAALPEKPIFDASTTSEEMWNVFQSANSWVLSYR